MSGHEWKPGDVATVSGEPVTFYENEGTSEVMFTNSSGFQYPARHLRPSARPLVVIDPEDAEAVERLLALFKAQDRGPEVVHILQAALREFANPTPPKPDEPLGLGAVVEDASGDRYVRTSLGAKRPWCRSRTGNHLGWVEMDDAPLTVIDEGVQP